MMPRIRNIKPDFFRHEALQDLESEYGSLRPMLVYAGLWTQSGKNGVFKWKPRSLKLDILPFISFNISDTLDLLESHGFIVRFEKDGESYGYITKFSEHQAISHKEKEAPAPCPDYPSSAPEQSLKEPRNAEEKPGTNPEPIRNSSGTDPDTADIGHRTYDIGSHDIGTPDPSLKGPKSKRVDKEPPEKKPQKLLNPEADRLALLLLELHRKIDPKYLNDPEKAKSAVARWSKDIDLLIRRDGRTPEEVERVLRWAKADSFWSSNILSGDSLRENFPKLLARMQQPVYGGPSGQKARVHSQTAMLAFKED